MHDLGKLVFAFSVFWVYLLFAQYIVIWYGDHSGRNILRRAARALHAVGDALVEIRD